MGMMKIYQGRSKPAKKKPGWKQAEAEYQTWLAGVQNQTLFGTKPKAKVTKLVDPVVRAPVIAAERLQRGTSLQTFGGAATKPVARPDILYHDQPELLARELAARQVKHNTAPAYNKGPAQFVTEEELTKQLVGSRRR